MRKRDALTLGAGAAAGALGLVGAIAVAGVGVAAANHPSSVTPLATEASVPTATPATTASTMASSDSNSTVSADANSGSSDRSGDGWRRHVRVVLRDVNGNRVGQVDITARRHGGNEVSVEAWNLAPGFHGFHLHAVGLCDPAGAKPFASAGGHFNPTGTPEGMQAGAFPVLLAGPNGRAEADFVDPDFTIAQLSGSAGTAVVIHTAPDNYANIPARYSANGVAGPDSETQMTGDGGARVACGVVFPAKPAATATTTSTPMPPMSGM